MSERRNPAGIPVPGAGGDRHDVGVDRDPAAGSSDLGDPGDVGDLGDLRQPRRTEALPGELKPLDWTPGRGPISDAEALGVMRRRKRVDLASPARAAARRGRVPDALPPEGAPKKPAVFRLPPRALARAHARAEMEGVPLTTVLEEMLLAYADGQPQSPAEVAARIRGKKIRWQRR